MFYFIANQVRKMYWKIFRPITIGVKIICLNNEKVLLVKTSYSSNWQLPGGGIKKGETVFEAATRELKEECNIAELNLRLEGVYSNFFEGKNDHIVLFSLKLSINKLNFKKNHEVLECRFFELDKLPEMPPGNKRRIEEYLNGKFNGGRW